MKKIRLYLFVLLFTALFACQQKTYNLNSDIDRKVDSLLSTMTLEEKVGQMTQVTLDVLLKKDTSLYSYTLDTQMLKLAFDKYKIGSVLNKSNYKYPFTREQWNKLIETLQKYSIKATGIPIIYGIDAIHGTNYTQGATLFPQEIGLAATFNPQLVQKLFEIAAYETRASGIPWVFTPVMDIGRDPRDPRMWETFGEDPYLTSQMGKAAVTGLQGTGKIIDKYHVAACMKHFLAYNSTSGKDRQPFQISPRLLYEKHVPGFQAAVDAGVKTAMISSGIINDIPVHSSHDIITVLLRQEMGFKGFAVTDWKDIENLHFRDRVAQTQEQAVKMAIDAGIDMSMVPFNFKFADYLIDLVKKGKIPMERINNYVRRILKVKYELGLFDTPVTYAKDYPLFASEKHKKLALQAARESITLLKNNGNVLPLRKTAKVLVCGPNANSMRPMNGGWTYTWQGEVTDLFAKNYNTFLEAIEKKIGKQNVVYVPGVIYKMNGKYYQDTALNIDQAVKAAKNVDYILLFLGENSYTETPGDLVDLYISENQTRLALALAKTGKPIILILNEGRPRIISKFEKYMNAVVQTYLPGNFGGDALADILFGDINPSGKLPYSYPKYPNSLATYDFKPAEYKDTNNPQSFSNVQFQYEFGTGLSYTTFEYSNLHVSQIDFDPDDTLTVQVTVKNTGNRAGKEVVMLFASDLYASVTPDNKRLIRFDKIFLKPGQTKIVKFKITARDLSFINRQNARVAEAGDFVLRINNLTQKIHLTQNVQFTPPGKIKL